MNREIKFRAWFDRPGSEEMYYNVGFHPTILEFHHEKGLGEAGEITVTPLANGYHIMQFTGLKDKNEVDVWEGDIVECIFNIYGKETEIKFNAIVVYNSDIASFQIAYKGMGGGFVTDMLYGKYFIKVIGNKYQNPEYFSTTQTL